MDKMPKKKKAKLSKPLREKKKEIKKATRFMAALSAVAGDCSSTALLREGFFDGKEKALHVAKMHKGELQEILRRHKSDDESSSLEEAALDDDTDDASEDDDSMPPESEWNAQARALKAAITKAGALEEALRKGSNKKNDDESSFEEATLDDDTDASSEEEQEKAAASAPKASSTEKGGDDGAESVSSEDENDDDDDMAEEEEETEDPASSAPNANTAADPPQQRAVRAKALQVVTTALVAETNGWPWAETFQVVPATPLPFGAADKNNETAVSIHDDLKREVAFYDCALEAVLEAKAKCQRAGIPFSRPDDFFAEMVKTDDHMAKVKDRLIFENKKMEAVAQRKSNKEQKLRAKETHANKLAEKSKRKKDHFRAVEEWAQTAASHRGGRLRDDDDVDSHFQKHNNGNRAAATNKKRQYADKKYGHGGKRGRFKSTDPKALNDMSSYNRNGNFGGMGTKKSAKGGSGGANRKGKRARDASRSR